MSANYQPPDNRQIRQLLGTVQNIAVVGLSPKPTRPSHRVARAMQGFGFRIIPVRPAVQQVLGETAYARLEQVREAIDLVNVFRAPIHVDAIVDSCIALDLPALWLQDGVINEAAAARAQQAGLLVVMDRCIFRDYVQMTGGRA